MLESSHGRYVAADLILRLEGASGATQICSADAPFSLYQSSLLDSLMRVPGTDAWIKVLLVGGGL